MKCFMVLNACFSSVVVLLGLYDKPVVIEGKRERKTPVFLASQTAPQTMTIPKSLTFEVSVMVCQKSLQLLRTIRS